MSGIVKAAPLRLKGLAGLAAVAGLALGALALDARQALAVPGDPTQAPAAGLTEAQKAASKVLFSQYSCGACHVLAAAGGNGHIGPSLDGNAALDQAYVKRIIANGQGAMPSFGGMISGDEIDQLAQYIVEVRK